MSTNFDIYVFISDVHVFQFYLVHVLCFIFYNVYLFTYIVLLHDVNNNNDVLRLTVTGRMPLVEQELLSLPEHMCSSPDFIGVCVAQSLVFCVVFCRLYFVPLYFFVTIVLSVLLLITPLASSNFKHLSRDYEKITITAMYHGR